MAKTSLASPKIITDPCFAYVCVRVCVFIALKGHYVQNLFVNDGQNLLQQRLILPASHEKPSLL